LAFLPSNQARAGGVCTVRMAAKNSQRRASPGPPPIYLP
jgi:hypothetical protein